MAMTLNTATLNNSHNISVSTKQAALAAIVDQLVVDACNLVSEGVCMYVHVLVTVSISSAVGGISGHIL